MENLYSAWQEFKRGKSKKIDILKFELNLEDNLFQLYEELKNKTYRHFNYTSFYIQDPKLRHINKAVVRDRVLHQAVVRILYPIFDNIFIYNSYSSRLNKGTHLAVERLKEYCKSLSNNNHRNIFILKCDIKRFFDSIDQNILLRLIGNKIKDNNTSWLVEEIVRSFSGERNKGLPLGNATSQLFANIYLNQLDQFVKHKLKVKYYLRYSDDFVVLDKNKNNLIKLIYEINIFLENNLELFLHPKKIAIRKFNQGIDWLGYVVLPYHKVLRAKTKKRMFRKIEAGKERLRLGFIDNKIFNQSLQSYYGVFKHCNGYKLRLKIDKCVKF